MVGIITYGAYIPRYRIKVEEIARVWGANAAEISGGLGVFEKICYYKNNIFMKIKKETSNLFQSEDLTQ